MKDKSPRLEPRANNSDNSSSFEPNAGAVNPDAQVEAVKFSNAEERSRAHVRLSALHRAVRAVT